MKRIARALTAAVLCAAAAAAGCVSKGERRRDVHEEGRRVGKPEFRDEELEKLGLEVAWEAEVADERIVETVLLDDCLYLLTKDHELYAVNMDNGRVKWVFDLADELTQPLGIYRYPKEEGTLGRRDELYALSKDRLYVIDLEIGELLWRKHLRFGPSSPPAGSFSHIYVGSYDDRVYAIFKTDQEVGWQWRTDGDVVARAAEDAPAVFIASEDGDVYSFNAATGEKNWTFHTRGRIAQDPLAYKKKLIAGSDDFNVYAIKTVDGYPEWVFPAGERIVRQAAAVEGNVYVTTENGFVALSFRDGQQLWEFSDGDQVLAQGRDNVYVLTRDRQLAALDAASGKLQWKEPFTKGIDFFVTNPASWKASSPRLGWTREQERDRSGLLILGFNNGWIVALKEKGRF